MRAVIGALCAGAVLFLLAPVARAQPAAQLAFSPPAATIPIGSSLPVDITVANIPADPGLGGYSLALAFNPAVVRLDSLTDSGFVTSGQNIVICTGATIDNAAGTATLSCTAIPLFGQPGMSTTAPVALLHETFTALAPGTSALSLAGTTLQAPAGADLAAALSDGSIQVTAAASPAPATATTVAASTATPGVSATPTAPATATVAAATPTTAVTTPAASPTPSRGSLGLPQAGSEAGGGSSRTGLLALLGVAAMLAALGLSAGVLLRRRRRGSRS